MLGLDILDEDIHNFKREGGAVLIIESALGRVAIVPECRPKPFFLEAVEYVPEEVRALLDFESPDVEKVHRFKAVFGGCLRRKGEESASL